MALQLLQNNAVENIALADRDPLVAAFWQTVFSEGGCEWLVKQVQTIEVTLEQWRAFKKEPPIETRERALACLFLNRTSFSGILAPSGGPIGGQAQASEYTIDCRFPRETLVKRIKQAAALRDRVAFVEEATWAATLNQVASIAGEEAFSGSVCYYFDPPFIRKAEKLYTHYFDDAAHLALRDAILELEHFWILSYDAADRIKDLYARPGQKRVQVELLYSTATTPGSQAVKEMILTNLEHLPEETRLWRRDYEWQNANGANTTESGVGAQEIPSKNSPVERALANLVPAC